MCSSRHLTVALAALVTLTACSGSSTSYGGFERASTSSGSGLQKVKELGWKTALDAAWPLVRAGRDLYAVRKESVSIVDDEGKATSTHKLADAMSGPLTVVSGRAYYGSGKSVDAVKFPEGEAIWTAKVDKVVATAPAVAGGLVFVAAGDLVALDADSGAEKWSYGGEGDFSGPPSIRGSDVFVASSKGFVYAIDMATGQPRWTLETPSSFVGVPVAVAGDMLVVPGQGGLVWGIFAETGRERWRFPTHGVISVGVAAHEGRAWIGTEAGVVSSVDMLTGQEVWRMTDLPAIVTPPTWASGIVYVGCDDGKLVALDATEGAHKWSFQLESEPLSAPIVGDGALWIADAGGRVYSLR